MSEWQLVIACVLLCCTFGIFSDDNSGHSCGDAVNGCHVFYCLRGITQPKKATSGSYRQQGLALHTLPIISLFC